MTDHILVIDDDPRIRAFIATALEDEGYAVEKAADGAQALRAINERPPSLLLLDLQMPVLDGWGVMRSLRERKVRLPIVILSAMRNVRRELEALGVNGYLQKPFELDDLLVTVRRLRAA